MTATHHTYLVLIVPTLVFLAAILPCIILNRTSATQANDDTHKEQS